MIEQFTIAGVSGVSVVMGGGFDYPITYYDDPVDSRFEESAKVRQHGIWPDYTWFGKRAPEVHFDLLAPDSFTYNQRRLALTSALVPMPELGYTFVCILNIDFTGYEAMTIQADVESFDLPRDGTQGPAYGSGQIIFRCPFPFYQSATSYAVNTGAPSSGVGGRTYPKTYPYTYGAGSTTGGEITIHPGGNVVTYPVMRVLGPATYPTIARNDGGTLTPLTVNTIINAGDYIDIDTAKRTIVTSQGVDITNLRNPTTSWWGLRANVDNDILYRPYDSGSGTDVIITWYNYYHF